MIQDVNKDALVKCKIDYVLRNNYHPFDALKIITIVLFIIYLAIYQKGKFLSRCAFVPEYLQVAW